MNRISRWPASMLANSLTDSEMMRTSCEMTSIANTNGTMNARAGTLSMPAGSQLCR